MGVWVPLIVGMIVAVLIAMVPMFMPKTGNRANDECVFYRTYFIDLNFLNRVLRISVIMGLICFYLM